ncbi:MAG: BatA domain-containing protein [Planctomycetes bacterium]|nr:BatA domain-containing protein [Planctomycetota bacterium]
MQFLNPALLAGVALFAVPLVIHLLNRQRHKRREWAAMEFLLRAYKKQRNRLRTENLLLLLLRCLVPILLALAIARPLLQQAAGLLAGSGTVHHVLVLDASYSMGLREGGAPSPFERARALVGRLLDRLDEDPQNADKVTLVTAGVRPRFLVRGDMDTATARSQWLLLQKPEDGAGDLGDALQQVAVLLEESGDAVTEVYVLTDLQVRAFGKALQAPANPPQPELTDTLRDTCERLQKHPGTRLHWIDTGPFAEQKGGGLADNQQITDLRITQPAAVLRTPVGFTVQLKNRADSAATCEVTLEVDGQAPERRVVSVPAGAEGEAEFQVAFRELGRRRVRAAIQGDALAADDERYLTVDVRERIRVLVVDGAADEDPLRAYRHLYTSVLDPDPTSLPTFAVEATDTLALLSGQRDPRDYDVTVLADIDRLNQRSAQALAAAVRAGRGLLVTFGEHTDAESFNLLLHGAGDGPMPLRLLQPTGGSAGSSVVRALVMTAPDHPVFAEFEEPIYREVLQAIPVHRWFLSAAEALPADAKVLATVTDAVQSPLLVGREFGEGRALFLTSAPASEYRPDRWNRLDDPMAAFPLLHGMVRWLALPAVDPFLVPVGAELSCTLAHRPEEIQVQRPERDGRARTPVAEDPLPLPGDRFRLPPIGDTVFAGFYTVDLVLDRPSGKEPVALPFAVNVDPDEGELRYAAHEEARQSLGIERVLDALPATAAQDETPQQNELGPLLLLLTLLCVLGEATLARFVSVRRN